MGDFLSKLPSGSSSQSSDFFGDNALGNNKSNDEETLLPYLNLEDISQDFIDGNLVNTKAKNGENFLDGRNVVPLQTTKEGESNKVKGQEDGFEKVQTIVDEESVFMGDFLSKMPSGSSSEASNFLEQNVNEVGDNKSNDEEINTLFLDLNNPYEGFVGDKLAKSKAKNGENFLGKEGVIPVQETKKGGRTEFKFEKDHAEKLKDIVAEGKKDGKNTSQIFRKRDLDSQGNVVTSSYEPDEVTFTAFTDAEYQRFYEATYKSLQDLVNLHKALKENHKKIQAGEQIIDPSRVKALANVVGKKETKESKSEEEKRNLARKAEIDKNDIEDIATEKAQQKKHYQRVLEELEIMFQVIHTTNRNRKDRVKLDIKNRSIKLINQRQVTSQTSVQQSK